MKCGLRCYVDVVVVCSGWDDVDSGYWMGMGMGVGEAEVKNVFEIFKVFRADLNKR